MIQTISACRHKAESYPLFRSKHAPLALTTVARADDVAANENTGMQSAPPERLAGACGRHWRPRAWAFRHRIQGLAVSSLSLIIGLCAIVAPAQAQLHETEKDGYVLRANVANAQMLPPESIEKYKLRSAALLINVVVLKQGQPVEDAAVAADVVVESTDLLGVSSQIDMREVKAHTGISYLGTFDFPLNGIELAFHITARPAGSNTELGLRFRERLPQPAR
jgi:hypothetical protein